MRTTAARRMAILFALQLIASLAVRAQGLPARLAEPEPGPVQPLPFSHYEHIAQGLQCSECHVNPDAGPLMGYPAVDTCMSCHKTSAADQPSIKTLAAFAESGKPIPWVRVYQLPDYVYWSHATHIQAGITCVDCHGPVAERDVIAVETTITRMAGCVACHDARQVFTDCGACHEPQK